jgi:hypothetical protein
MDQIPREMMCIIKYVDLGIFSYTYTYAAMYYLMFALKKYNIATLLKGVRDLTKMQVFSSD